MHVKALKAAGIGGMQGRASRQEEEELLLITSVYPVPASNPFREPPLFLLRPILLCLVVNASRGIMPLLMLVQQPRRTRERGKVIVHFSQASQLVQRWSVVVVVGAAEH